MVVGKTFSPFEWSINQQACTADIHEIYVDLFCLLAIFPAGQVTEARAERQ